MWNSFLKYFLITFCVKNLHTAAIAYSNMNGLMFNSDNNRHFLHRTDPNKLLITRQGTMKNILLLFTNYLLHTKRRC